MGLTGISLLPMSLVIVGGLSRPALATVSSGDPVPSSRSELIVVSTTEGLGLGLLGGLALNFSPTGVVGSMATGGLIGLGASFALSLGRQVPGAMPTMFVNGAAYGMLASYIYYEECDPCQNLSGALFTGAALGTAVAGASAWLLHLTPGAAGAMSFGMYVGVLGPVLGLYATLNDVTLNELGLSTLLGATAGLVAGPFLDRWLDVDRDRWLMVTEWSLGGAALALVVAGFVHPGIPIASLFTLAGGVIGGGLGAAITLEPEAPNPQPAPPPAPPVGPPARKTSQPLPGTLVTLASGRF